MTGFNASNANASFGRCLRLLATLLLLISFGATFTACSNRSAPPPPADEPEEDYIYHRIKYSGETVAVISAWYTRSAKNWPEIVDANPKLVPSKLRIGDLVRIPKRLVRRFSSLPQDFVSSFRSGVNKDSSATTPESSTANDFTTGSDTVPSGTDTEPSGTDTVPSGTDSTVTDSPYANENPASDFNHGTQPSETAPEVVPETNTGALENKPEAPGTGATSSAPANDAENQKIRDQLMQELLQ